MNTNNPGTTRVITGSSHASGIRWDGSVDASIVDESGCRVALHLRHDSIAVEVENRDGQPVLSRTAATWLHARLGDWLHVEETRDE
jgi:hypothetical protein